MDCTSFINCFFFPFLEFEYVFVSVVYTSPVGSRKPKRILILLFSRSHFPAKVNISFLFTWKDTSSTARSLLRANPSYNKNTFCNFFAFINPSFSISFSGLSFFLFILLSPWNSRNRLIYARCSTPPAVVFLFYRYPWHKGIEDGKDTLVAS